jgi:hypothetical protein
MKANATISNPILSLNSENYEYRKFRILEILDSLPSRQSKQLKKMLPVVLGISRITFSNWLNASKTDTIDIPSSKLAVIAMSLNVQMIHLFNVEPKKYIIEKSTTPETDTILKSTGLVI